MPENNKEKKLLDIDLNPYPFSPGAFKFLKEQISQHIKELVNESIRISKRHRSDTVSTAHIERASEYLIYSVRRKVFRHVGTLGGIFFGSALSIFLSMWMNSLYPGKGVLLSVVFGVIGSVMITLHMSKD
jgi:hypothetical protein